MRFIILLLFVMGIFACDDQNTSDDKKNAGSITTGAAQGATQVIGGTNQDPAGAMGATPAGMIGATQAGMMGATPAGMIGATQAGMMGATQAGTTMEVTAVDLEISPNYAVLAFTDPNLPPSQEFVLMVEEQDGTSRILNPNEATWEVDPPAFGQVNMGIFTSLGQFGIGRIKASYGQLNASAEIIVQKPEDIILDGLPMNTPEIFDQAEADENCRPSFIYPEPMTVIPLNLSGLTLQWNQMGSGNTYMVEGKAGQSQVRWFTNQNKLTPEGLAWESLKRASLDEYIDLTLAVIDNGRKCVSLSMPLIVDRSELIGAVYYWSTGDFGIMRLAAGETAPEPFLTQGTAPNINCPACHALSRDGSRVAFTKTSFPPFGDLAASLVSAPSQMLYNSMGIEGYFPSFSPDPRKLVAGSSGNLVIRDSDNGMLLGQLPMPSTKVGGEPDWSWQGDKIVAVLGDKGLVNALPNVAINAGSIYQWSLVNDQWQDPVLIYANQGALQNNRPSYSPDGQYIAFNTQADNANQGQGMSNPNTDLWITYPDANHTAVRLDRANQGSNLGNNWPKWSPTDRRGRMWLAFSSLRNYGHILVNTEARPQIWVTSIDPNIPHGQDPSSPAFWLPYQNTNSGNHIPYWSAYEKR